MSASIDAKADSTRRGSYAERRNDFMMTRGRIVETELELPVVLELFAVLKGLDVVVENINRGDLTNQVREWGAVANQGGNIKTNGIALNGTKVSSNSVAGITEAGGAGEILFTSCSGVKNGNCTLQIASSLTRDTEAHPKVLSSSTANQVPVMDGSGNISGPSTVMIASGNVVAPGTAQFGTGTTQSCIQVYNDSNVAYTLKIVGSTLTTAAGTCP